MARDLAAGNNRWTTPIFHTSITDFSMGLWMRYDGAQAAETRIFMNGGTSPNAYGIDGGSGGGLNVSGIHEGLARFGLTTLAANTWTYCHLSRGGGTSRFYVNGIQAATNGGTPNVPGGTLTVGCPFATSIDGKVAEPAFWSVALDPAEVMSLALGFSPLLVRPQSLLSYWPLIGVHYPEPDIRAGRNFTIVGGAPIYEHPRILVPRPAIYVP